MKTKNTSNHHPNTYSYTQVNVPNLSEYLLFSVANPFAFGSTPLPTKKNHGKSLGATLIDVAKDTVRGQTLPIVDNCFGGPPIDGKTIRASQPKRLHLPQVSG